MHEYGHCGTHAPSTQVSVDWQADMSSGVQPTQRLEAGSQMWCAGSHGRQSLLDPQEIMGSP